MARLFNDAQSEYLIRGDASGISGYPYAMVCLFNPDANINQTIMALGDTSGTAHRQQISLRDPADSDLLLTSVGAGTTVQHFLALSIIRLLVRWLEAVRSLVSSQVALLKLRSTT